jgi:hypothetical protein
MKNTIKALSIIALVAVIGFTFAACKDDNGNNDPQCDCTVKVHPTGLPCTCPVAGTSACDCTEEALSFENFSTASVLVKNNTGERLVAFKNTVSPNALISGIPAYADNHGLKKDTVLFSSTEEFVLLLITEAQYNANKNNLAVLNSQAFARLYALYNPVSNPFAITIGSNLGGSGRLIINNASKYNVVLHLNYPTGETIGYIPAYTTNTAISLATPGSYELYPVFTIFNTGTLELFTITPTTEEGAAAGKPFKWSVSLDAANPSMSVDVSTIFDQVNVMTSGGTYLKIVNNSTAAVVLFIGSVPQTTPIGTNLINPSESVVYPLLFTRNPDGSIPLSRSFALQIGTSVNPLSVASQEYELDYLYEIEVTGEVSNLQLGTVTKKDKIDLIQD